MGLYAMSCKQCDKGFMWFSGSLDQRCAECRGGLVPPFMYHCARCKKEIYVSTPSEATVIYCSIECAD